MSIYDEHSFYTKVPDSSNYLEDILINTIISSSSSSSDHTTQKRLIKLLRSALTYPSKSVVSFVSHMDQS